MGPAGSEAATRTGARRRVYEYEQPVVALYLDQLQYEPQARQRRESDVSCARLPGSTHWSLTERQHSRRREH